ncbi:segregation/condensation protein A [Halobacterium hubeiense]|uniref:segregation/condensation protein A n=1 Tax=Halobacterium hubeiense TaxID=1407499 RepID=UPI003C70B278
MTSEGSADERSESAATRAGSDATREQEESEPTEPSETSSGERSEPRDSEGSADERSESADTRAGSDATREGEPEALATDGGADDVPLDITGHEDRKAEREADSAEPDGGLTTAEPADEASSTPDSAAELIAESPAEPAANPDDEVEPVELLVQLAKDGEIEPWDIDIVAVTDKFLEALDEADLRTSGRALFYASVLLRMKSDAMLDDGDDEPDEEDVEQPPWEAPPEEDGRPAYDPVDALESEMDRRLERKHARGNPETLDELVRDLREAERGSWWKESREYDTSDSPQGFRRGVQELDYRSGDEFRMDDEPTAEEALGNAHEEDIEATIDDVREVLDEKYGGGRTEVLYEEVSDAGESRVQTFLALLFLAHRGAVTLEQDDLFGDLWVCEN